MTTNMILGSLLIIGVGASALMSGLKAKFGSLKGWKSKLALIAICLILGGLYQYIKHIGLLTSASILLGTASTFYAFFMKKGK